jgi:hypothetical protein
VCYGDVPDLARDIEERGLLQPILVRPIDGTFEALTPSFPVHFSTGHKDYKYCAFGFCQVVGCSELL